MRGRSPYFFQDPVRLTAALTAGLLFLFPSVPPGLLLWTVVTCQATGLLVLLRILRGRRRVQEDIARDSVGLVTCAFLAGFLLMLLFGPPLSAYLLGALTLASALLPDTRLYRAVAGGCEIRFDPAKLSCILGLVLLSLLTDDSAEALLASLVIVQFNAYAMFFEKYSAFVRWRRRRFLPMPRRLARRVAFCVLPWAVLLLRVATGLWPATVASLCFVVAMLLPEAFRLIRRRRAERERARAVEEAVPAVHVLPSYYDLLPEDLRD